MWVWCRLPRTLFFKAHHSDGCASRRCSSLHGNVIPCWHKALAKCWKAWTNTSTALVRRRLLRGILCRSGRLSPLRIMLSVSE